MYSRFTPALQARCPPLASATTRAWRARPTATRYASTHANPSHSQVERWQDTRREVEAPSSQCTASCIGPHAARNGAGTLVMYGPPPRMDRTHGVGEVCRALTATIELGSSISNFDPPAPREIEATPLGVGSFLNTALVPVRVPSRAPRTGEGPPCEAPHPHGPAWRGVEPSAKRTCPG